MKSPLLKNVIAAVAGYFAMAALLFVTFSITWAILGPSGSFEPGVWEVSTQWVVASILLGLVAAKAGGFICAKLAVDHMGVLILVALVLVLGVLSAIPDAAVVEGPRPDEISMFDAMSTAEQPRWLAWLNPVIGIVGVLLGARLATKND